MESAGGGACWGRSSSHLALPALLGQLSHVCLDIELLLRNVLSGTRCGGGLEPPAASIAAPDELVARTTRVVELGGRRRRERRRERTEPAAEATTGGARAAGRGLTRGRTAETERGGGGGRRHTRSTETSGHLVACCRVVPATIPASGFPI